jgi:hypothetical protein
MVFQQIVVSERQSMTEETKASIEKRIRRGRGFEPLHVRAGFTWLEKYHAATGAAERTEWLETLESIIHGILRPLGGIEEAVFDDRREGDTFFSFPAEWDTWVFDLAASVIVKNEDGELGRRLWQPILSFGLDRIHWVDAFLRAWFIRGLRVPGCEVNFFREWKAMIAYAWTQANWRQTVIKTHHSDEELFRHLMGFSSIGHGYLQDEKYRPFIARMKPEYEKWADWFFPHPEATSAFANFLTFPSSADHLRDGVRRLAETAAKFKEWHWRNFYHLDDALLKLLEHDWRTNSRAITRDTEIRKQFSTILKTMTDRQIPRALELQDQMRRAK